jgi:hypothetical protein
MSAIVINTDSKNSRILAELAKRLGGEVTPISDEQLEDLMLGSMMDREKTGKTVSKERIMKLLSARS